jgi:hypothetical protein
VPRVFSEDVTIPNFQAFDWQENFFLAMTIFSRPLYFFPSVFPSPFDLNVPHDESLSSAAFRLCIK